MCLPPSLWLLTWLTCSFAQVASLREALLPRPPAVCCLCPLLRILGLCSVSSGLTVPPAARLWLLEARAVYLLLFGLLST